MAQLLARQMQIPAEQTMAIGDHDSDASLLQWAGIGVAMGNASPAAKAAADVISALFESIVATLDPTAVAKDPKTRLQELLQTLFITFL